MTTATTNNANNITTNDNQFLLLTCAPSGTGKSTLAHALAGYAKQQHDREVVCVAADDFFVNDEGVYNFRGDWLRDAHNWCFKKAKEALKAGESVIIHNTNTKEEHRRRYFELAHQVNQLGYLPGWVHYGEVWLDYPEAETLYKRNVHGVPLHAIDRQIFDLEWDEGRQWAVASVSQDTPLQKTIPLLYEALERLMAQGLFSHKEIYKVI